MQIQLKKSRAKGNSEAELYFKSAKEEAEKKALEDLKSKEEAKLKEMRLAEEQMQQHQFKLELEKKEREVRFSSDSQ